MRTMPFFEIAFGCCMGEPTGWEMVMMFLWVRAQGQATGSVTREFETSNLGTGRLGKAAGAGGSARQLWFLRWESG